MTDKLHTIITTPTIETGTGSTKHRAQPNGGQSTLGPNLLANPKRMSLTADPLLIGAGESIAKGLIAPKYRMRSCVLLTHPSLGHRRRPEESCQRPTDGRRTIRTGIRADAEHALAGLPRWLWLWLCAFLSHSASPASLERRDGRRRRFYHYC
jgi:hypothetical protein